MISELLQDIAKQVSLVARHVTLVSDPDGLLSSEAQRNNLANILGIPVVDAEGLALRVHYELNVRGDTELRLCYVGKGRMDVLDDIACEAWKATISVAEFFPNFVDRQRLLALDFSTLEFLYAKHLQGRVTAARLDEILRTNTVVAESDNDSSPAETVRHLGETPDWRSREYLETLSQAFKQVLADRAYTPEIAAIINNLNLDFQHYLRDCYFSTLNSSGEPKVVHAVAAYMHQCFGMEQKVAFVVVDGMAWWQWEVLRDLLESKKMLPFVDVKAIFAWLPSITALSRQALFRGAQPITDYRQTPAEEEKLWKRQWESNPIYMPVYQHNPQSPDELNTITRRLAIVDTQLDKKMHQSSDYYDLHDLTCNWAVKFAEIISKLRREGFNIVLTTDHGNVLAQGKGTLSTDDKAHLYLANSRGERFVYFNTSEQKESFRQRYCGRYLFSNPRENWLALGDDSSFSTNGKQLITHGGSHFMETIIPLIIF